MRSFTSRLALICALSALPLSAFAQTEEPATTEEPADSATEMDATTAEETTEPAADAATAEAAPEAEAVAEPAPAPVEGQIMMQGENTILVNDLIGSTVYSTSEESVGDINDMIVTVDGSVEGVVIGVGGFLGIGEKKVAVEMGQIDVLPNDDGSVRLVLNATKADLEAAPAFVTAKDQAMQDQAEQIQTDTGAATDPVATEPAAEGEPATTEGSAN